MAKDILAYVEVEGLKEGIHDVPIKLILPQDIVLKNDSPVASVEIKKLKF